MIPEVVGALTDGAHNGGGSTGRTPTPAASSLLPDVAWCLQERDAKGADSDTKPGHLIPVIGGGFDVAHSLRAGGFDASDDGTGRGTPLVPVVDPIPYDGFQITAPINRQNRKPGDPCHTLAKDKAQHALICFSAKDHGADAGEIAPTLRSMGHDGSHANGGGKVAVAFHNRQDPDVSGDVTHPLGAKDNGLGLWLGLAVRRLTPRECERLQGFPDDYTLIPVRGKPAKAGPRYRALGNSMAVPVMRWIGKRIGEAVATAGASCTPR